MNLKIKSFLKKVAAPFVSLLTRLQLPFVSEKPHLNPEGSLKRLESIWPRHPVNIHRENAIHTRKNLTIIVPVYNVEQYLEECLDSIISQQTKYNYSVICIDDGSTDSSPAILERYKERITIVHQENGGLSKARNAGLRQADGEYVLFVDSDDILLPGAIEELLDIAYKENADIVEGKVEKFTRDWPTTGHKRKIIDVKNDFSLLRGYAVAKVMRASLFRDVIFPERYYFEDSIMAYWIHPSSKKSIQTSKVVYGYRFNDEGITAKASVRPKCLDTIYISSDLWREHFEKFGPSRPFNKIVLRQMALNHVRISNLEKQHPSVQKDAFAIAREEYLSMFSTSTLKLKGKRRLLDKSIRNSNYGQYRLLSERWTKLPN